MALKNMAHIQSMYGPDMVLSFNSFSRLLENENDQSFFELFEKFNHPIFFSPLVE